MYVFASRYCFGVEPILIKYPKSFIFCNKWYQNITFEQFEMAFNKLQRKQIDDVLYDQNE